MRTIEGKLFLEVPELIKIGIPESTIKSGLHRFRNNLTDEWSHIPHESDKRIKLINFDSLSDEYKIYIKDKMFNSVEPKDHLKSKAFESLLTISYEDESIIKEFKTAKGGYLPKTKLDQYLKALPYVSMLAKLSAKEIHALGFYNAPEFYQTVINKIKFDAVYLPHSYGKLNELKNKYKRNGAIEIIEGHFKRGATNVKVNREQSDMINHLYSLPNQYTCPQIADVFNRIATQKGWKNITDRTIHNHINRVETEYKRRGFSKGRDYTDLVISRDRPKSPNLMWIGDGYVYELYYQKHTDKGHSYWERKVVYMVIDAFNDYIVGFAIGDSENNELARKAWENACKSKGVLPYQIKTDNYGKKDLTPFYASISHKPHYFTPSAVGNARDKVIEPMFAKLRSQVIRNHNNCSGANITAKEQPNREHLDKIKHSFPDEHGVINQIANDLILWNTMPRKKLGGKSLEEQWKNSDHSKDRILNDFDKLNLFGTLHNYTITQNTLGIVFTVDGIKRNYIDWNDIDFAKRIGKTFHVKYDVNDFSKILIYDNEEREKYILQEDVKQPMCLSDNKANDRSLLNKKLNYKKEVFKSIVTDADDKRIKSIIELGIENDIEKISSEGLLKLMPTVNGIQKDQLNMAKQTVKEITKVNPTNEPEATNNDILNPVNEVILKPIIEGVESIFQNKISPNLNIVD